MFSRWRLRHFACDQGWNHVKVDKVEGACSCRSDQMRGALLAKRALEGVMELDWM